MARAASSTMMTEAASMSEGAAAPRLNTGRPHFAPKEPRRVSREIEIRELDRGRSWKEAKTAIWTDNKGLYDTKGRIC